MEKNRNEWQQKDELTQKGAEANGFNNNINPLWGHCTNCDAKCNIFIFEEKNLPLFEYRLGSGGMFRLEMREHDSL